MDLLRKYFVARQPILTVITVAFGGLILIAVATVLYLGLSFTTNLTRDYHQLLINTALKNLDEEVKDLLIPIETQALWLRDQVESGKLDIQDYRQVETFMRGSVGSLSNLTGGGILYPDGTSRYLVRDANQWIEDRESALHEIDRFFRKMEGVQTYSWGELFWFDDIEQTIFDIRVPLRVNGRLEGILVFGVTISELSNSILRTSTDQFLTPFILYDETHLLAHPLLTIGATIPDYKGDGIQWLRDDGTDIPLPLVKGFQDTILDELLFTEDYITPRLIAPTDNVEIRGKHINGDLQILATRKLQRFGEIPWTIGVYINGEKSENTQAVELFKMALAGILILFVSVLTSIKIARKMAKPVVRLASTASMVRKGHLEAIQKLPRSRLRELDQASQAFNEMISGLKERDMIREVFGRYVPESIAASLMQENGQLEPVSCEATILFSDIVKFTQLTEQVGPERIVSILNEYFSNVVQILEMHGGVVTQFQGDAILATFNVPIKDEAHVDKAIRAAVEIQDMLENTLFQGIKIGSRIGINTGMVVAGAVGAEGRLNYTVHGDSVNLASRVEELNKTYETNILISGASAIHAKEFALKEIGSTQVRGHTELITLFVIESSNS